MSSPLRGLTLADLRLRKSLKWRRYPQDVLPMWVAEMDTRLAEPIVAALEEAIALGDTGYAGTGSVDAGDYGEALVGFARERWGWTIEVGQTLAMPDVMLGVSELLKLVTQPGDAVVVNPPVYPPFYMFLNSLGRRVVEAPLTASGRLDFDTLDRALPGASAYLLCSPHNPTGTVHTEAELASVARLAASHGVRVIADEIHAPLVLPGATFVPYLSVAPDSDGFSLMSASKAWNLAGLKAAIAIAAAAAGPDLARVPVEVSHGVSHLGVLSHVAEYRHGGSWLDGLLADLDGNRALLGRLLDAELPAVGYRPPEATYLA
ncbi:MAG: MalY/PatB family protein, partial [Dehalococcoidia bacterium]